MNVAKTIIIHNPAFYEYYSKKHHKEGKKDRVALSHVVRKLLRIIYHLEIMDKKFDSKEIILNAYKEAVNNKYRFFSFGDCMFIK